MKLITMIKEFLRKKDEVLVGKVRVGLPFIYGDYDRNAVMVHFHCYENEVGKRRIKIIDHGRGIIATKTGGIYSLLKEWKKNKDILYYIPTYSEIKSGKPVWII